MTGIMTETDISSYRRRAMSRAETLAILEAQGADLSALSLPKGALREKAIWNALETQGIPVPCGHCRAPITSRKACIRDHKIRLRSMPDAERSVYDQAWNQWYLCLECNSTKTHKRGLTGLGSDASLIAKLRRIENKKAAESIATSEKPCRKARIRSMPFPKRPPNQKNSMGAKASKLRSRPIPSRPFPKSKRPMSGKK